MNSSDSEGFESADEGNNTPIKRERKKRLSSSNYSDNISDHETKKNTEKTTTKPAGNQEKATEGWDNWGDDAPPETLANKEVIEECGKTQGTDNNGWDDFDDWGDTNVISTDKQSKSNTNHHQSAQSQQSPQSSNQVEDIKLVTDRLAATTTKSEGWGWGWGVDSLLSTASAGLSTATAGLSTITSQVSQGISTVLETVETGIGVPDPEELARQAHQNRESQGKEQVQPKPEESTSAAAPHEGSFPFGSLFSGVSKFVETTGTKVISGGLDTLETIGKKTMEVLQDGDPLLANKRAMLGLDSGDKPVLSQLLREAKDKADEEDKVKEAKREAKEVHYETLFDDYEGLVHLEALEMLSKQVSMRIDERLRSTPLEKRQDMKETLQQVAELCEMPEEDEDDDDDDETSPDTPKPEAFHDKLQKATKDIGLKLQFQPLIKHYSDVLSAAGTDAPARGVYKRAVGSLAACTALGVQLYHKTGEMLLVKPRRSTADEADALTQMTVVLTKHISELATLFTETLNTCAAEDQEQVNNYITNVFLEAGNSSKYIENAFQLTLPIIQIGAV